jgi:hypothetical protein
MPNKFKGKRLLGGGHLNQLRDIRQEIKLAVLGTSLNRPKQQKRIVHPSACHIVRVRGIQQKTRGNTLQVVP